MTVSSFAGGAPVMGGDGELKKSFGVGLETLR